MKILAVIISLLVLLGIPVPSQAVDCAGISTSLSPAGYQQLTVSTTAVALTVPVAATRTRLAVIGVESNPIRFRDDGTDPSATVGTLVKADNFVLVCGADAIRQFKAIRQGASDATLNIHYYQG